MSVQPESVQPDLFEPPPHKTPALMLNPPGIGVCDCPPGLFPYPTPNWQSNVRAFEPAIAAGFSDEEAWAALFSDPHWCDLAKSVYGNRPTEKQRRQQSEAL